MEKKAAGSSKLIVMIALLIAIIIGMGVALVFVVKNNGKQPEIVVSESAAVGSVGSNLVITKDSKDTQGDIEQKVKAGSIAVKMTGNWFFSDNCSTSNAYIANSEHNQFPLTFELTLADSGEVILTTPEVPVGSCIEQFGLDKVLESGQYSVLVAHRQMKDGEVYNQVVTATTITVE